MSTYTAVQQYNNNSSTHSTKLHGKEIKPLISGFRRDVKRR
jgi:hypothetical protein